MRQVCSAIDIQRRNKKGFSEGIVFYRLSTYKTLEESFPIRDYKHFKFPKHENRYINYRFIGKIITKDKIIDKGLLV